ncbi:MAG: ABC transporter permease [Vicinamibacterales bacterium]
MLNDLKVAFRSTRSSPLFTLAVVAILSVGIAVNTAAFGVMRALVLRDLPFPKPDALVHVWQTDLQRGAGELRVSGATFLDWQRSARSVERLGAYYYSDVSAQIGSAPLSFRIARMSPEMFSILGVQPLLGRSFTAEEAQAGSPVAVLSWGLWQEYFHGAAAALGQTLLVDGVVHEIVGVMPETFVFPLHSIRLWIPARPMSDPAQRATAGPWLVVGRLAPGMSLEEANAEFRTIADRLAAQMSADQRYGVRVVTLRRALLFLYDQVQVMMFALVAAVAFILVLSCANLANLTLVRNTSRSQEYAVRGALGASRRKLVRQCLIESFVPAAFGTCVGIAAGVIAGRVLEGTIPEDFYRVPGPAVDLPVVAFAVGISLLSILLFAGFPAFESTRVDLVSSLNASGRGASQSRRTRRIRTLLAVSQIAVATLLLGGALFCLHVFMSTRSSDSGFQTAGVLTYELALPESQYQTDAQVSSFYRETLNRVASVPGVSDAVTVHPLPLNFELFEQPYEVDGHRKAVASRIRTTPGYFGLLGIPVVEGRDFRESDSSDAAPVVVVNRKLAETYWPGEPVVGRQIRLLTPAPVSATIIGVVNNSKEFLLTEQARPQLFQSQSQFPTRRRFVIVKTKGDPAALSGPLRQVHASVNPTVLPGNVRTLERVVEETIFPLALASMVLGILGSGALSLAALGVYGVIAYATSLRAREIAIRMALGATSTQVRSLIVGQSLRWAAWGLLLGGLGVAGLGSLISSVLGPLGGAGWTALGGGALLMLLVTLVAAYGPAARASRLAAATALQAQ